MPYVKLSVSLQAARQLRRVALELSEMRGSRVTHGAALEEITGDWLARLYRASSAQQATEPPPDATTRPEDWQPDGATMRYTGPPGGRGE